MSFMKKVNIMNKGLGIRRGFTLVEITLVVGILVVLSSIVLVTLNIRGNSAEANNVKRKIDLESIQKALDLRAQETGESLPSGLNIGLPEKCVGAGAKETFDLQSINWSESVPSRDTDIRFDARSCDDENCSGETWPGLNLTDPAAANSLSGIADAPFFQYKADFIDNTYASGVTVHTSYIRPSGQCTGYSPCYNSLSAWEAAQNRDLTASNEIEVAQIGGSWTSADTSSVDINGWTTNATHYIKIYTMPESRHNGKWDTGKYRMERAGDIIWVREDFIRINGLQFKTMSTSGNPAAINIPAVTLNSGYDIRISNNIIQAAVSGTASNPRGINDYNGSISGDVRIWNNIIYNHSFNNTGSGINISSGAHNIYIYDNTLVGNYTGISAPCCGNTTIAKNNISYSNTDNYNGNFNSASTNNLSGPSSPLQTDAPGTYPRNDVNVAFVDAENSDFHLASPDINAKNAGADLSADEYFAFNTDIEGQVRPVETAWDIGADEAGISTPNFDFMVKDVVINTLKSVLGSTGSAVSFVDTAYSDFIKGTAPSPLLVSESSNPNDAESGVVANEGNAYLTPYTSQVFSSFCYDLTNDLAPLYLGSIPKDPKTGTDENTGYLISVDSATKVVCLKAPGAENDEVIENCRR